MRVEYLSTPHNIWRNDVVPTGGAQYAGYRQRKNKAHIEQ